jgi:hypothetical protein
MATPRKLDPNTPNVDVGIVITHSDVIKTIDIPIGRTATILKATVAGDIVYQNGNDGEPGWITLEAGEGWMIAFDRILTSATINGTLRSTTLTAAQIFWATTAQDIKPEN